MSETISKKEIERIIREPGKVRGVAITSAGQYILEKEGQYVIKSPKITIKEEKCMHKGGPDHDFKFVWV